MDKKLWAGAFKGGGGEITRFNSLENTRLDRKLAAYDMLGSLAHVKMLAKQRIITAEDANEITRALGQLLKADRKNAFRMRSALEDVHSNVENAVTKITPAGAKMHTARSRNDQVLLDMRMYMRDETLSLAKTVIGLQKSFVGLSSRDGPMVGYTHTRVAQPLTISFWCDSFVQSLDRDLERILGQYNRMNLNPLGACALAGTSWDIDRHYVAKLLAFDGVERNALAAIGSRGETEAELLSNLALLMAKLSGLSEELIWLSQKRLIWIPDAFCTGSSIMPNKRNPDVLELIRARSARVSSDLMNALAVKKGLISGYHSGMQETKHAVMDGIDIAKDSVNMMAKITRALGFNQDGIRKELEAGFAQATEIADALARKGVPFREAHGIVGRLVDWCGGRGIGLTKTAPLQWFDEKEWRSVVALERPRLKTIVRIDPAHERRIDGEMRRISEAYSRLES